MQKLGLNFSQQQRLSPQQIQFIKLLQIPTAELEKRIEEELEINPALEEGKYDDGPTTEADNYDDVGGDDGGMDDDDNIHVDDTVEIGDYLNSNDIAGYKMQGDGFGGDDEDREMPLVGDTTLMDTMLTQLGYLPLTEVQETIGQQLIGSIESDGYIRRDLESIVNDLAFAQNLSVELHQVEEVLRMIQKFDPPGIAARNLQECLVLQLERRTDHYDVAMVALRIVEDFFEEFTRKHYDKIRNRLGLDDQDLFRDAIQMIIKCNPKPGETSQSESKAQVIIPDFILTTNTGKLEISLNARNAPELRISNAYTEMLETYDKSDKKNREIRETAQFVKQKLDSAKWFIDAIKQRQNTLLLTMHAIADVQRDFFFSGDDSQLRPMILKDIAERIDMDISTVSRVANSKYVQTEFGTFALKHFFSEGISTDSGEDVSNREVKAILKELISQEDKQDPLSDEALEKMLNDKGYRIARRTVAKYREQLNIPVARLRREV